MAQPTFQRAKAYNRGGFVSEISSTTAGEQFDVGAGPNVGVVVRVIATSSGGGDDITSVVFGGVTLTALAQEVLPSLNAKERFFYGVGLSLTGLQSWTATTTPGNGQLQAQIYAANNVSAATFASRFDVAGETLNSAVPTNANSIAVGLVSVSNSGSGVNAATSPTVERWDDGTSSVLLTPYIIERPGSGSSVNLQAESTGNTFTPGYVGRAFSFEGSVVVPVLTGGFTLADLVFSGTFATGALSQLAGGFTLDDFLNGGVMGLAPGIVATEPFKNWSGTLLPGVTVPNVVFLKLDRTTAVALVNQTTAGDGVMTVANAALVAGTFYIMVSFDATGASIGAELVQAT